jgi:hypothetical protein
MDCVSPRCRTRAIKATSDMNPCSAVSTGGRVFEPRVRCVNVTTAPHESQTRTGRTNSTIAALNLDGSFTKGSCPDSSNQTSFFDGAASASK